MGLLEEHLEDIDRALWGIVYTRHADVPAHVCAPEDMHQAALLAVVASAPRFDPSTGARFTTWALIKGSYAIIDELRALDWVPRSVRASARKIERATAKLQYEMLRAPTDAEIADELELRPAELDKARARIARSSVVPLDDLWTMSDESGDEVSLMHTIPDPKAIDPLASVATEETRDHLADAMERLPERERMVVALYYWEEMTQMEIAEIMGVTESRICQLLMAARDRLASDPRLVGAA